MPICDVRSSIGGIQISNIQTPNNNISTENSASVNSISNELQSLSLSDRTLEVERNSRYPTRITRQPIFLKDFDCSYSEFDEEEPSTFNQANKNDKWKEDMKEEMDAIEINNTWSLVPKASGMNIIECKWVYKIKKKCY